MYCLWSQKTYWIKLTISPLSYSSPNRKQNLNVITLCGCGQRTKEAASQRQQQLDRNWQQCAWTELTAARWTARSCNAGAHKRNRQRRRRVDVCEWDCGVLGLGLWLVRAACLCEARRRGIWDLGILIDFAVPSSLSLSIIFCFLNLSIGFLFRIGLKLNRMGSKCKPV